jgi:hypothetical protein
LVAFWVTAIVASFLGLFIGAVGDTNGDLLEEKLAADSDRNKAQNSLKSARNRLVASERRVETLEGKVNFLSGQVSARQEPAEKKAAAPKPSPRPARERRQPPRIEVPSVVGKTHQYAQDRMQASGLYNLREEDATGLDRLLLDDRNWTVVSQSPAAGSRVSESKSIVLKSKKKGE